MAFNRFNLSIVIQVMAIVLISIAFAFTCTMNYMLITRYFLLVIIIIQALLLIFYINKINRNLTRFFNAFQYEDYKPVFSTGGQYRGFNDLHQAFNRIIAQFEAVRVDKEKDFQFFSIAVQQIGIGLLGFDENGKIKLVNKALLKLINRQRLGHINELSEYNPPLEELIWKLKPGQNQLFAMHIGGRKMQLAVKASFMKVNNQIIRLISFQDIKPEIEMKEINAWQKIIRIINHEIINSLSPVNLLSSTLIKSIEKDNTSISPGEVDEKTMTNLYTGLNAIRNRSQGLTHFVENYRQSMQLPGPKFEQTDIIILLQGIVTLFSKEMADRNINFSFNKPPATLSIKCDKKMIEQVIVNLLKNAMQAVEETLEPKISIRVFRHEQQACIEVSDNGKGIPADWQDHIFIPYFSTRKGGSGIGLSLSRQIMHMHSGTIQLMAGTNLQTTFRLLF